MNFNKEQVDILSKYFADISKIIVASAVIGFFIPTETGFVTFSVFAMGLVSAIACLVFSLQLNKSALA